MAVIEASQQPLAARVEELKNRLMQPNPSWLDYSHWLKAMGKLYGDPRGTLPRQIRPKVALQWRAKILLVPGRAEEAVELGQLRQGAWPREWRRRRRAWRAEG